MGSVILNLSTRGAQLCRWMRLLWLYDVQRTKVGVVAVSLDMEQIFSAPPDFCLSSPFPLNPSVHRSFRRTCWQNGV
jgi:hypothetical protein